MVADSSDRRLARDVPVVREHKRNWREFHYVYPVISRRARGLSIGINLNPGKVCNFNCIYCQVNRRVPPSLRTVDLDGLSTELNAMLDQVVSGALWQEPCFAAVPEELRRMNDIAFSGDGEPTTVAQFLQAIQLAADAKAHHGLDAVKLVVISNATRFHTETFRRAIPILQASNGEVWAKLDAGTPEYYQAVNNSKVEYKLILRNIEQLARTMPVVIQTMLLSMGGLAPSEAELAAYTGRLRDILAHGGRLRQIQLYTVARPPAQARAASLSDEELDGIAVRVQAAVQPVPVNVYYGADVPPQDQTT